MLRRIVHRTKLSAGRRRILGSATWIFTERILTMASTFVVGIFVANHLGSNGFGTLNYSTALFTLFASIVSAGLSGVVVKDLVRNRQQQDQIMGTVFVMRLVMAALAVGLLAALSWGLDIGPDDAAVVTTVVSLAMFLRSSEVIDFWFQSETRQRNVAISNFCGTLSGSALRVGLVALDAPLIAFAWAFVAEAAISSLLLFVFFVNNGGKLGNWHPERLRALAYLRRTWPLLLSGVANAINMRSDLVLLGVLAGSSAAGTYAVAARLSEVWYFIPTAIAGAAFPALLRAKDRSEAEFRHRLRILYAGFAWLAISVAVVVTLVARPLIEALYDEEFWQAADVLIIHVWTAPFMFMSVVFSKWLVAEELLKMSLVRHGSAAALNVGLNFLLVPTYGPTGAAYATLISYAFAHYLICFFRPRTWPVALDMTRGLLAPVEYGYKALRKLLG